MRVLSGIQPSGRLHLGNYCGAVKQHMELQKGNEAFYFIADFHALTTVQNPRRMREYILDLAIDYLALGLDPEKTVFFQQSGIPQVPELAWILTTVTPMALLERCHSYKDKVAHGISPSHGIFAYPVLMAADILAYQSDLVPVGKDQKQHIEVTRDIAGRFNTLYGGVFKLPREYILSESAVVPGIDGQKMSKAYDNTIEFFADEKEIHGTVMRIMTDSKGIHEPKDPETCTLFKLFALFSSPDERKGLADKYRQGGVSYKNVKEELAHKIIEHFKPFRKRRAEIAKDRTFVRKVLDQGAGRAREIAQETLSKAKKAVGVL